MSGSETELPCRTASATATAIRCCALPASTTPQPSAALSRPMARPMVSSTSRTNAPVTFTAMISFWCGQICMSSGAAMLCPKIPRDSRRWRPGMLYRSVARVERQRNPGPRCHKDRPAPDFAALNPGYGSLGNKEEALRNRSACLAAAGLRLPAALAFATFALPGAAQSPDTALANGKIITLDERSTIAEALAVRDGTIVAVGRSADIRGLAGPPTPILHLRRPPLLPGPLPSPPPALPAPLFYPHPAE